jgi:polysaccharide biosynthesis transport protein
MNTIAPLSLTPRELVRLLIERRKLWLAPAIGCTVLAAAYSLVMPRYWEASQALVVRQETAGSQGPTPGKFADLYEMRTMQETILELAKSQQVVVSTLKAVDLKLNGAAKEPTAEDIEKFRGRLKMLPPDGGEFGKTEVFYFYLKDCNRERAIELVGELCRQLNAALKELRAKRAEGLIAELEEQVALATQLQEQETRRLEEFEAEVGADLGELRMLHSASSGQSDLRQEAVQLEADVRKFETELRQSEQLLAMLKSAEQDAQQLVATPNSLLVSQPSLRRLKEGLVDAQLATSRLGGTRSDDHPRVKAAVESEEEIRADLRRELLTAIRGAEAEIRLGQQRVESTRDRLNVVQERLSRLAERRAEYSNRVAAVENSRVTLDRARQNLSTAKAAEAAARSGSLVTRIDNPETGPYPAGPGRTVVTGAGAVGGLMLGLGLVFLTTASPHATASALSRHGHIHSHEVSQRGESVRNGSASSLVATRTTPPGPISDVWPAPATDGETPAAPVTSPSEAPGEPLSGVVFHPAPNGSRRAAISEATPANGERERTGVQTNGKTAASTHALPQELVHSAATSANGETERPTKAPQPAPANVLPAAVGALPLGASPVFGGMSLQEALQAAREAQR